MDVEFRVVSDRREGLLLALGQAVIASGFTLLRQRMAGGTDGVVLTMLVRGPQAHLPALEETLGTHPQVRSFEATRPEGEPERVAVPPDAADTQAQARANAVPSLADSRRIEALLPQLAHDYPNIFVPLLALERELAADQREPALRYIGQRVGTWVYKRDFALGGQLALGDAVRHIALPALRQIVQAEMHEDALRVRNSPFCHRGGHGACCHFLRGMLGGLLGGPHGADGLRVVETHCRNTGAEICSFEFHD
ncbi:V4R domain-containing protein [Lysobacter sp. FW306-1B-D06B]|uniref:V4R domain-containing protein n=1 Tax=unclassified Lysobacter TaxID=2635362 RepID=UPI001C21D84E|nr:hypothetical protein [Lysobacter sp. MMG2]